jgi:hypothetical protein
MPFLFDFVLSRAEQEPLNIREQAYRAAAHIAPDEITSLKLVKLADDLRAIQESASQLILDFRSTK